MRVPRVAFALTAVAAALLAVVLRHPHQADPLTSDVHSAAAAGQRATAMLDRTYVLGAVRVAAPPSLPTSTLQSDVVQRSRWYTVGGDLDTVVAMLRASPPAGFGISQQILTETSVSGVGSGTILEFHGSNLNSGSLDVAAVSLADDRVSLRLEAVVGWS